MELEGWVPNATGNVSFSVIGTPLRSVVHRQHFWSPVRRWILLSQHRTNSDRKVPKWFAEFLRRRSPSHKRGRRHSTLLYVMLASSQPTNGDGDVEGALDGIISVTLPEGVRHGAVQTACDSVARLLATATQEYREGRAQPPSADQWNNASQCLFANSAFHCQFRMLRSGKCFFTVDESKHRELDVITLQWLTSQCYYFLKDAVHQHYHHGASTDAIIELTLVNSTPDWRLLTQRGLYRKVISLRRSLDDTLLSNALGVLAYTNVFAEIFQKIDKDRENANIQGVPVLPTYHPEQLKASIEIRRDTSRRDSDKRKSDGQFLIASVIAAAAVYVALYPSFLSGSSAKSVANLLLREISAEPLLLLMPIPVAFILYNLYVHNHDLADYGVVRAIYRLLAWLPRRIFLSLGAGLSLLFLAITVFCAWMVYLATL